MSKTSEVQSQSSLYEEQLEKYGVTKVEIIFPDGLTFVLENAGKKILMSDFSRYLNNVNAARKQKGSKQVRVRQMEIPSKVPIRTFSQILTWGIITSEKIYLEYI